MKLKTIIATLGLAGLGLMSQVDSARAVVLNLTSENARGVVLFNSTLLGAYTNIRPSYAIAPSSITFTKLTDVNYLIDIGSVGLKFIASGIYSKPPENSQAILDYLNSVNLVGAGSLRTTSTYDNNSNALSIRYNGGIGFPDTNPSPIPSIFESISGTIVIPNYGSFDPIDFPTYLQGNLRTAALNRYTLSESDSFSFSDELYRTTGRATNFITSISVPFNFNPAEGVVVGLPLLIGIRVLRKKLGSKQKSQKAVEKV